MIILDTNVVSEFLRPAPEPAVDDWLGRQPLSSVFLSAISEAELRLGVALLPVGRRRTGLAKQIEQLLAGDFVGRILPFDSAAAGAYADISADRKRMGRPISQNDALIAGIAKSRGASLATRNIADFLGCGVEIINPWPPTLPNRTA